MDWHYQNPKTGQRDGPTSQEILADRFRTGEFGGETLVWRTGMPQWLPASRTPEFAEETTPAIAAEVPEATAVSSVAFGPRTTTSIGYFTPGGGAPARVQANLAKYAKPTGPVGDWPLNDSHVDQLSQAVRYRKRILSGYNLARLMVVLYLLTFIGFAIATLATFAGGRRGSDAAAIFGTTAFLFALLLLFWLASNAIRYCRAWGALTLAILSIIGLALQLGTFAMTAATARTNAVYAVALPTLIGALFAGAFAWVFFRAWRSTSKYLDTPVWCQEALAVSERVK